MANNRIYLKCAGCGAEFFLGKRYGDGYFYVNYHEAQGDLGRQLNDFFDAHAFCHGRGPDCFKLAYEFPDEEDTEG
ncbi:MAG: hypothetical protein J6S60_00170 [Oscillospiraceae bacterium]|nr:hypothetical protein [Oscillospiraceae bacterium]